MERRPSSYRLADYFLCITSTLAPHINDQGTDKLNLEIAYRYPSIDYHDTKMQWTSIPPVCNFYLTFNIVLGPIQLNTEQRASRSSILCPVRHTRYSCVLQPPQIIENEKASRLYANCLLLYEQVEDKDRGPIYLPKCLCILSRHPFFGTFKQFLAFLYTTYISNSLDETESIERILDNFIFEVPMSSSPTTQVIFKIGSELRRLSTNPFLVDFPLEPFFHVLTPDNILKIIGWICTDRIIIFVSQNPYLLGLVIQTFLWLLQPIKWCHPCIAILPSGFSYLLQSPHPLMVGVCDADMEIRFNKEDDAVAIYLDDNQIVSTLDKEPFPLPAKITDPIKRSIKELVSKMGPSPKHASLAGLGKAFEYKVVDPLAAHGKPELTPVVPVPAVLDPLKVKACFMPLIKDLVGDYEKYMPESNDTLEEPKEQGKLSSREFDYEAYCNSKEVKERPFFSKFARTQLFEQYGEHLNDPTSSDQYLIEALKKVQSSKSLQPSIESITQQSITAPDPDYCIGKKSMLIKHVLNKCETFPAKLNNSLFLNNQSIAWEAVRSTYEEDGEEKLNPFSSMPMIEGLMKLSFAKSFMEYFKKCETKAKKFWRITKVHKSSQPNSGSRSLSSRNNNRPRSVNTNACPGIIDTSSSCPHCTEGHSLWDIREKMHNNKELSIPCKKCGKAFIPHFSIHPSHYNSKFRKDLQQEYVNPYILLAALEEDQKHSGASLENSYFYQRCPVIFWNLLIYFSDIRLELGHHSDSEMHAYNIHEYMSKDEEELHDSGSFSEAREFASGARPKAEAKARRHTHFNVTKFLNVHTNDQEKHRRSKFANFDKQSKYSYSRASEHSSLSNHSKGTRTEYGTKIVNIDISRKALKRMAIEMYSSSVVSPHGSLRSERGSTPYSSVLVPKAEAEPAQDAVFEKVEKGIDAFSTARKDKDEPKIDQNLKVNLTSYSSVKPEDKTKGKASRLIRNLEARWDGESTIKRSVMPMPNNCEMYDKCIKRQLEQKILTEPEEEKDEVDASAEKKAKVAQQFLCRAMELLLKKVSFAVDKGLVEVQNYAICNQLLDTEKSV
eukprot:TRINITY_DN2155_c0_g1_i1.p1 TRINITY_DN2155_c0_g1~~TRINITY_DN2155_c0_g1_i1.p1  ORF type:complete len:1113 (+),score=90.17 TRINITY_DN2155_c0_g1_i1:150-3341(+)